MCACVRLSEGGGAQREREGESEGEREVFPSRTAGSAGNTSRLQDTGDQAQETSRGNQCLLTYTNRLIYDESLKQSFIFHHL